MGITTYTVRPGELAKDSGVYECQREDGTPLGQTPFRTTLVRGTPAPPTPEPQCVWRQVFDSNPGDASSRRLADEAPEGIILGGSDRNHYFGGPERPVSFENDRDAPPDVHPTEPPPA